MTTRPEASRRMPELPTVPQMSLDDQIALAELAVIRRDERIRRRTDALVRRVKTNTLRHAGGGLLIGIAGATLAWWLSRRKSSSAASAPSASEAASQPAGEHSSGENIAREAGLSLAVLLPLIWPYLPPSVRKSVTPGTASTVLSFISPVIARLFRRRPPAARQQQPF